MFEDMSSFFQLNLFESDLQSFSVVFPNLTKFSWFCKTSQCEFLLTTLLPKPFHINHLDSKTSYPCWTKKTSSWHFFSIFTTSLRYQILPLIRFFFVLYQEHVKMTLFSEEYGRIFIFPEILLKDSNMPRMASWVVWKTSLLSSMSVTQGWSSKWSVFLKVASVSSKPEFLIPWISKTIQRTVPWNCCL